MATGEVVLAYFALVNIEGRVEVRFLGTKTADLETAQQAAILALPAAFKHAFIQPVKSYFTDYVAPFISGRPFLQNQLARAPSFN